MNLLRRALLSCLNATPVIIHTLSIDGSDTYTGKTIYLHAFYDTTTQVFPTWSITSGNAYASINANGKITINEGVTNQSITVQAVYTDLTVTKTITISYDNELIIEGNDTMTGTSGNVIARYNSTVVTPTWSITSGNAYGSIDNTGAITITASGSITVSASYSSLTTTKVITLVYEAGSSSQTTVNEDGSVTTQTNTVVENQDGSTTTTTTTETVNDDGSSSTTSTEITENDDGSSTTTSTTTNSDGSSSETTSTTSAPDAETGAVTTQSSTSTTNSDGTSSETSSTLVENQDGSSTSSSNTLNYDENGDLTGSTENETTNNADGSSSSTTTNFDENGDPTDKVNENIDAIGNEKTQNIEYDSNGDEIVVGYTVDTTNNEDTGSLGFEGSSEDAINTGFVPFDINSSENGFDMVIYFRSSYNEQKDIAHGGDTNEQWTILDMTPDDSSNNWVNNQGLVIRWQEGAKPKIYTQLRYNGGNAKNNIAATTIDGVSGYFKFGLRFYNGKLVFRNLLTNTNIVSVNNNAFTVDLSRVKVTVGSGWDAINQVQFRYSTMDLIDFQINKIHEWTDY